VYACGQKGTLLSGRAEAWDVVATGGVAEDFWDLIWFSGALYVSSLRAVYTLTDSGLALEEYGRWLIGVLLPPEHGRQVPMRSGIPVDWAVRLY
jgi:hypothetical protein